jgi:hypothetical protein
VAELAGTASAAGLVVMANSTQKPVINRAGSAGIRVEQ